MSLTQYGVAVKTLSNFVREYSLEQGNMKQTVIAANLKRAELVYKDLFRSTLWELRENVLTVDPKKNTIKLPADVERLISISVVDVLGKKQPLTFNSQFNTVEIKCPKNKCSCNNCHGQDTLCEAIDYITVKTNAIEIHGETYTQTIRTRNSGNGSIQNEIITPCYNDLTETVDFVTSWETLCSVELTTNGCIAPTAPNMQALIDYVGYPNAGYLGWDNPVLRQLIPVSFNYYGEWNFNAAAKDIIHIFRPKTKRGTPLGPTVINPYTGQQETLENDICKVIICYQTNGETPGAEILIPDYAEFAVKIGMQYRTEQLRPRPNLNAVRELKYAYREEKHNVFKYLNPIKIDDLAKQQTLPKYW